MIIRGEGVSRVPGIKTTWQRILDQKYLLILILPCIIWLFIFSYIPMGGIIIAFKNYRPSLGVFKSDWVGLLWFKQLFQSSQMANILKNTIGISLLKIVFGFPIPIILALMINEITNRSFLKVSQTVSYLPHFMSWVIIIVLFQQLLSIDGGVVNVIREDLFGLKPIDYFGSPKWVWGLAFMTEVWKEVGWSSIIYIAALSSVDPQQHEAAIIDGAGKLRRIWHVNLPGIKSTIVILFILAAGGVMNANFTQLYIMRTDAVMRTVEVIDTYVYTRLMTDSTSYGYGTAVTLFKSLINIGLLLSANFISNKVASESLF